MESDDDTLVLPKCFITVGDIKKITRGCSISKAELARKLGVGNTTIYSIDFDKFGLSGMIERNKKKSRVSKCEIEKLLKQGYLKKDAANELGIDYRHFFRLLKKYGLENSYNKTKREITKIVQEGYFYED